MITGEPVKALLWPGGRSELAGERSGDHILLLFAGQRVKADRIAGDADRQIRILLRVFYRIEQLFPVQHIDVEMLSPLHRLLVVEVAVQQAHQVVFLR